MPQNILLTGASGFLAKHILLRLLNAGHHVRGTLRSLDRADEVRDAVAPHLETPGALENLSFVALDLGIDQGWDAAMEGIDVLMHTASPFPFAQPKDESAVIRPAVDGTLRALSAAAQAGTGRVIMTSSSVAISGQAGDGRFDENDWTDISAPGTSPYAKSKTLAEKAAWDFAAAHPEIALTVINPSFILGPALDGNFGTSLKVIERILAASDPAAPRVGFSTVDVRDVALMHVDAITTPETIGKRILSAHDFIWFREMAEIIARACPDRKIVTRQAPDFLVRILGLFDPSIRQLIPSLGRRSDLSTARAKALFGIEFRPVDEAVRAAAASVIAAKET